MPERVLLFCAILLITAIPRAAAEITVSEPADGVTRITQGQDYATWVIGNPWDMAEPGDVVLAESKDLAGETLADGVYSFQTLSNDNRFWMVFFGLPIAFNGLETGERHPIDTSTYRYLTLKVRMRDVDGQPLETGQPFLVRFFRDANWQSTGEFGVTRERRSTFSDWTIIQWNLGDPAQLGVNSNIEWTDFPFMRGLRFNPTNNPGIRVEIDWIRLSAGPEFGTAGTVAWADDSGNGPYEVFLTDGEFVHTAASGVSETSIQVDLSDLPSGEYVAGVTDGSSTDLSPGAFAVNDAPLLHLITPDRRGDQSRGYGIEQTGNAWSSIDVGDIAATPGLTDVRFDDPPGTLTARPTSSDPRIRFDTTAPVDASVYRMLCYTFEARGPRDVGTGSVARILWGDDLTSLATSRDVVVQEGLNEYCVGDMTDLPTVDLADSWSGSFDFIRFDPHEFPVSSECMNTPSPENCRKIRLDSFILAPFHRAVGNISLTWNDADADDDASISLFYDPDRDPSNDNEGLIVENIARSSAGSQWTWNTETVPAGTYNILSIIDDGRNATLRYSTGPVEVISDLVFADGFETP